ncbi:MAG: M20/M25/M40 family metallo-hydrolase [Bacteroidetes bacterium]|uniref:M20/M25/M40 family metallo-hydrolase n=1 Tax=Candidatus Cryptobacteroides merdavium TaxID=2840769 RepID=A0A9D9EAC9_9BACT|nr:M20/M25/M40 family metallo-hydrolase [Candidatus Cryptobacteroides merdavium]
MKTWHKYTGDAAGLLKEMVAIPSPSFHEEDVCRHISARLTEFGIGHKVAGNNIVAYNRHFKPGKRTLMLNAHIDTVGPSEGYSFDPYRPDYETAVRPVMTSLEEEMKGCTMTDKDADSEYTVPLSSNDFICGLGSNDDGGSVVAMISAFRHFYEMELPVNLMLALTCEEERSGNGGMTWLWDHFPYPAGEADYGTSNTDSSTFHPDWAIIGEPTGMKAAIAERGLLVLDGEARGVSGHAAREEGVNALYIAIEDIERLRKHEFAKISPAMGKVKLTVTQINAGTAHNVVPDSCRFVVDIRPTEMYGNEEILRELQAECRSTLTPRNLLNRSSATAANSPLAGCAKALGLETFSSPTTSDWMRVHCDAMKMGPGESSRSHRKDEFILVSEISHAIGTYIKFIETFIENRL